MSGAPSGGAGACSLDRGGGRVTVGLVCGRGGALHCTRLTLARCYRVATHGSGPGVGGSLPWRGFQLLTGSHRPCDLRFP